MDTQEMVLKFIRNERDKQDMKWGVMQTHSDHQWNTILGEEVGEAAKEVNDREPVKLYEELIQVAAVAVSWLEDLHRRGVRPGSKPGWNVPLHG